MVVWQYPKALFLIKLDTCSSVPKFLKQVFVRPYLITRTISFLSETCTTAFSKRIEVVPQMAIVQLFLNYLWLKVKPRVSLQAASLSTVQQNRNGLTWTQKSKGSFRNQYQHKCCPNSCKKKAANQQLSSSMKWQWSDVTQKVKSVKSAK